jgi:hypothetical protein
MCHVPPPLSLSSVDASCQPVGPIKVDLAIHLELNAAFHPGESVVATVVASQLTATFLPFEVLLRSRSRASQLSE